MTETRHYYYNDRWQIVEERVGTTPSTARIDQQYVYHPEYVDAVALRWRDSDHQSEGPDTYHYYLQDANYNVTALVNGDSGSGDLGKVVERYAYTPYRECTVLNGAADPNSEGSDWSDDANGTDVANVVRYTGRELDLGTGLQLNRNRFYASHLGRWTGRDPIEYDGLLWNLYNYVDSNPIVQLDPDGTVGQYCDCLRHNALQLKICLGASGGVWLACMKTCLLA
ncbi:MAG: RHS repeat-associated core domain-containing protein [Pirellulales bacterium]|nr:RHS repeat-associated core domain-containing protein [Pirellulales bacterium]